MSGILDKYDESIKLTYNHTYRILVHLKNITDNFNKIEKLLSNISKQVM